MQCYSPAKQVFEQIRSWGGNAVSKRLLAINALLLPVRRICSGGALTEKELTVPDILKVPHGPSDPLGKQDLSQHAPAGQECTICLEPLLDRPVRTPCQHWFCRYMMAALTSSHLLGLLVSDSHNFNSGPIHLWLSWHESCQPGAHQ